MFTKVNFSRWDSFETISVRGCFSRTMHAIRSKPPLQMASSLRNGRVASKSPAWLTTSPKVDLATPTGESASGFANRWFD